MEFQILLIANKKRPQQPNQMGRSLKAMKIIHFNPSPTSATAFPFNMAHHCVLPLVEVSKTLTKKGHLMYMRGGVAKDLRWHLQNPEFVRFLRDYLKVIVTPNEESKGQLLEEFLLQKAA
ncbi:MAG TPA: hypothetical protein VJH63_01930 [Candidatus Paceibacterota bacterium]